MYITKGQIHRNDKGNAQPKTPAHAARSLDGVVGPQIYPATILQRTQLDPCSLTAGDVMQLQRMTVNRAVCQLMTGLDSIQAKPEKEEDEGSIPNNTGMLDHLKVGVKNLSGIFHG